MGVVAAFVPAARIAIAPTAAHQKSVVCCTGRRHGIDRVRGRRVAAGASEQEAQSVDTSNLEGKFQLAESTKLPHFCALSRYRVASRSQGHISRGDCVRHVPWL